MSFYDADYNTHNGRPYDWYFAHHEAAHAVTAHHTGIKVTGVFLDLWKAEVRDAVMGLGSYPSPTSLALMTYEPVTSDRFEALGVCLYASKWTERRLGWDKHWSTEGDQDMIDMYIPPRRRGAVSRASRYIVERRWDAVTRVAERLFAERMLFRPGILEEIGS
jgi:hypothetical protein